MSNYDVVAIGHLDKGLIVRGDEEFPAIGGAVYYGGIVLAQLGLKIAIVTRLAQEDAWMLEEFHSFGIEVFPIWTLKTTGIKNIYPDPNSDFRISRPLGFAGTFQKEDLPDCEARLFYVATIFPEEIDLPFLQAVAARGPVALDAQGCARKLVGDEFVTDGWEWMEEGLSLVHYLKVDDREAFALTGCSDLKGAAELLAQYGPKEIVLTHKEGVVVYADGDFHEAPFRPRSLAGRTGRGDTCFSAYVGRRLCGDDPANATRFAAALTTLKLEHPGPFRGSVAEVRRLLASFS